MTTRPTKSDPEIAGALFGSDLSQAMATARARREGWVATEVDPLTVVVEMAAKRGDARDAYYVKLEGDWYNQYPPRVTFVAPDPVAGWPEAIDGTRWLPSLLQTNPGFALHPAYEFPDRTRHQLVCSSINLDYYWTHAPEPGKCWIPGKTKLIWTLSVIQDELAGPGYAGTSDAANS